MPKNSSGGNLPCERAIETIRLQSPRNAIACSATTSSAFTIGIAFIFLHNAEITDRRRRRVLAANPATGNPGTVEPSEQGGGSCGSTCYAFIVFVPRDKLRRRNLRSSRRVSEIQKKANGDQQTTHDQSERCILSVDLQSRLAASIFSSKSLIKLAVNNSCLPRKPQEASRLSMRNH